MAKLVPKLRFPEFANDGEWEERRLGEVCTTFSGGTPNTTNKKFYGGTIPFIRSAEIDKDKTELFITNEGLNNSSAKLVNKGDILIALYGANSGDVAISKIDGAINQAILCLKSDNNHTFIYNYLLLKKKWIVNTFIQGGQGNLSNNIIKSISLLFPKNNKEQEKIAETLSSLDDLINAENDKLQALQSYKKGLMQQLFPKEGERVPKLRFPEFANDGEWEEKRLGEVCDVKRGASPRPISKYLTKHNGVPWIKIGDVKEGEKYITSTKEKITFEGAKKSREVKVGDFILSNSMSFGRPYILRINGYIHDGWLLLRIKDKKILTDKFLYELLSTNFIQNQFKALSAGSTVNNLKSDIVTKSKILIPPTQQEQQKIANTLSSLDNLIENQSKKIEALKEHKKGLMQQMFVSDEER